ncbi:MAG: glycosyltransferase [Sphingopyxis sp.]|nr:glycosyltransferase [Sphingopyxis sp.]
MTEVTVIIPHYNDLVRLDRCLQSLEAQTYPKAATTVIVADNASPCGPAAVEKLIAGRARLVHATERGAGPARNAGAAATTTPLLAFIDSDCVAEPQWLENGIAGLAKYDICGGTVRVLIEAGTTWTAAQAFEAVFAFDNAAYVRDKGFSVTANLFTRRKIFDEVGPFANGVSEDVEWCQRATAHGHRLGFIGDACIGHPARDDWDELRRKWLRIQSETYALQSVSLVHRLKWLARCWLMPLSIVPHIPKIWQHPQMTTPQRRYAALRGLIMLRLWRWWDGHRLLLGLSRG